MENETIQEEHVNLKWLYEECKNLSTYNGERLPSLKLEEGKVTEITIDFKLPFQKWIDNENKVTKKIIPCTSIIDGKVENMVWWLNVQNPIYKEIIQAGKKGETVFKIIKIGTRKDTKYKIVH